MNSFEEKVGKRSAEEDLVSFFFGVRSGIWLGNVKQDSFWLGSECEVLQLVETKFYDRIEYLLVSVLQRTGTNPYHEVDPFNEEMLSEAKA